MQKGLGKQEKTKEKIKCWICHKQIQQGELYWKIGVLSICNECHYWIHGDEEYNYRI